MMLKDTDHELEETKPRLSVPVDLRLEKPAEDRPVFTRAPWLLEQFIEGELDDSGLDRELSSRFPSMPVMSIVNFRKSGTHGIATLSTQDGAASLRIEVDSQPAFMQFAFTVRSMLSLRYEMAGLTDAERQRWLENLRYKDDKMAFLWGRQRWESDYALAFRHRYYTNLYAFAPQYFESAARLTPDVTRQLMDWLENFWKIAPDDSLRLITTF